MAFPFDVKVAASLSGTVHSVLEVKGRAVHCIAPGESVYAAVSKLSECRVGMLLVTEGARLVGVVSERDYARKVILAGRASKDTRVQEIMSSPVVYVEPSTPLRECMHLMSERRIRHLPVLETDRPVGVISIGDLLRVILLQQSETIERLNTLLTDPYPG